MAISEEILLEAVDAIAGLDGLSMDADHLVEDVYLLAYAFPEEGDFKAAVASTCKAVSFLARGQVSSSSLKHELDQWLSYHYQHRVAQGAKADCRVIYRPSEEGIEVKGFGHRKIPEDFYRRMSAGRI
ncbi:MULTISPECIES: hypothetical protein [unclassified Adlercreutzia]|uniref:hypothetical protein n=1 Tax=unclassified Adlercreutzia TaxID=2636013 RepID=UPI0013E9C7E6|nr:MULTISPECIES: hypothetical protein [unclassified Adlercreutzia]